MSIGKRPVFAILSLALAFPVVQVSATTLTYSTYSAWNSNVTSPIELDLTSINTSGGNYSTAAGKTMYPSSGPAYPFVFTGPYSGGYQLTGGLYRNVAALMGPSGGQGNITLTLPTGGENAFLLGLGSNGSATTIVLTLSDGEVFNVPASSGAQELYGLSISHTVDWMTIAAANSTPVVDDFYFAKSKLAQDQPTAPAAECSTMLLLGGGLVSLFAVRRKFNFDKFAA